MMNLEILLPIAAVAGVALFIYFTIRHGQVSSAQLGEMLGADYRG